MRLSQIGICFHNPILFTSFPEQSSRLSAGSIACVDYCTPESLVLDYLWWRSPLKLCISCLILSFHFFLGLLLSLLPSMLVYITYFTGFLSSVLKNVTIRSHMDLSHYHWCHLLEAPSWCSHFNLYPFVSLLLSSLTFSSLLPPKIKSFLLSSPTNLHLSSIDWQSSTGFMIVLSKLVFTSQYTSVIIHKVVVHLPVWYSWGYPTILRILSWCT